VLDARGRRLRAALAAVLIKADAPDLRLVRHLPRTLPSAFYMAPILAN
jgi:hypothetical protein